MRNIFIAIVVMITCLQLSGNDVNWSFPPDVLATGSTVTEAQIAISPNGNVIAVWVEGGVVKSKIKPANMSWSSVAVSLSSLGASSPRLVSDLNGNAGAVWVEGGVIKAATKLVAGNWSSAATLSGTNAASPSLAVSLAGDLIAAWARNGDIETSTKILGANWQARLTIDDTGSAVPHVAIGGSGANARAHVVWQATSGSRGVVSASTKLVLSGSWEKSLIISDLNHLAGGPRVAVDQNGNSTAVWYRYDMNGAVYSNVVVQSASRSVTSAWSSLTDLSSPGLRDPSTLQARVAYDSSGNAIALWSTSFNDEEFSVQSAVKPVYGQWTSPKVLVDKNLYANKPSLAATSVGDALALYAFYNGAAIQVLSSELDITGFVDSDWSVPLNISLGSQNTRPLIAATLSGNTILTAAVWLGVSGMNNAILSSVGTKSLISPPSNLSVTQAVNNFGVFTEYYNTFSWNASSSPNVRGYSIYRNGVFLMQVRADVLQIIDDNRVQNGPVVYGVAAIDDQQSHSIIITKSYP